jgi:hypothetical protein
MQQTKAKIEAYFQDLLFDEGQHLYTVNDKKLPSVSGLIKKYTEPFKSGPISKQVAESRGITAEKVRAEWKAIADEACDRGHRVHVFGEFYPFDRTLEPKCKQEEAVKKFWDDMPERYVPLMMELRMYHKQFGYAGTADIILYDRVTDTLIIADYKTNKDLFKNYKEKKMLGPFSNLLDCPFNKYQLQLSYYQILLKQTGFQVSGRKLIWLKKTGEYEMYDLNDYTHILKQELAA